MPFSTQHTCSVFLIYALLTMFLNQLIDPDLRFKIFFKKEATTKKGKVDFDKEDWGSLQTIIGDWRKCYTESFSLFSGDMKTIAYESSLYLYFNSFDLPSYSSVLRIAGWGGGGGGGGVKKKIYF